MVPTNEFLVDVLFNIVVAPCVIVIFPKSSSVVGFVTAVGAVYVGDSVDVEFNIKLKDVAAPAQIVLGVAVAVAVISKLGLS